MEVVKRNLYSIICGIVAIVAVVLVFYPLGGMFDELRTKVNESGNDYTTIRSLLSKEHAAPDVDLEKAEQRKLAVFPTQKVIQAGEAAVTKVQEQSLKLLQEAMQMNRKEPLVREALPTPQTGAALGDFRIHYYRTLHDFVKRLNANNAPTQEEVDRRIEVLRNEMQQNAGFANDLARNDFEMELQSKLAAVADELGRERAARAAMYVSAEPGGVGTGGGLGGETPELNGLKSFDVHHPGIPTPSQLAAPTIVDVWAAQLGLWVQEDIVNAIVATNGNVQGVPNTVVKRLIAIKVPKEYITKTGRVALTDQSGMAVKLEALPNDPNVPPADGAVVEVADPSKPPKDPKASATGRICNDLYDVIHFTVDLDLDAARFRDFMAHLVSNRHITILSVDLEGVDRNQEFQALYIYGDKPVVRMRLTCEALFFREWTLPLMPELVKKMLNIQPPAAGLETTAMR